MKPTLVKLAGDICILDLEGIACDEVTVSLYDLEKSQWVDRKGQVMILETQLD